MGPTLTDAFLKSINATCVSTSNTHLSSIIYCTTNKLYIVDPPFLKPCCSSKKNPINYCSEAVIDYIFAYTLYPLLRTLLPLELSQLFFSPSLKSGIMWALLQLCGTVHFIQPVLRKICNLVIRVNSPYIRSSRLFLSRPFNLGEKLKRHKSPGNDQMPADLITAGRSTINSQIHYIIISLWNKEELPEEWRESIIVPIYKDTKTDCSNY